MADALLLGVINWHSTFFMFFAAIACVFGAAVLFSSNVVRMAFYLVISLAATAGLFFLAGSEFLGAMQIMIYVGGTLVLLIFGVMLTAQESFINLKTRGGEWVLGMVVGASFLSLLAATAFNVAAWRTPHPEMVKYTASIQRAEKYERGMGLDDELIPLEMQIRDAEAKQAAAMRKGDTAAVNEAHQDIKAAQQQIDEKTAEWKKTGQQARGEIYQPQFPAQQASTGRIGAAFVGVRIDNDHFAENPTLQRGQSGYLLAFQAVGIHLLVVLVGAAYLSRTRRFTGARTRAVTSFVERTDRKRGSIVPALLVLGMLTHVAIIAVVLGLANGRDFGNETAAMLTGLPEWVYTALIALNSAQIVLLMAVWSWQRWAVYALGVLPLVNVAIVHYAGIPTLVAPGNETAFMAVLTLAAYVPFAILIAALCGVGRPSYWSQMD
jgi:NADH:ubiquinone oxidoreductase subunit 6 (subunit J)